jgi:hypothetical protein
MSMDNHGGKMSTEVKNYLWQSDQQSDLAANQESVGEENDGFCLRKIPFILVEFFKMP